MSLTDLIEAAGKLSDEDLAKLSFELWNIAYKRAGSPEL